MKSSTEPAGDVIFRKLVQGIGEDLLGGSDFNEIPQMKIGRPLRYARSLLHGMGDDGDGKVGPQFVDQVLNDGRGNGIQGRGTVRP